MSNKSLTVLTPNGRRHNAKLTLNTTLLEVLEQVCQKFHLDPNRYSLKHHNKTVDLSAMFRFSGLPNNGFLEMEESNQMRKESDVQIVIQTESGNRFCGDFFPSVPLQDILINLCPEEVELKENPVIIYMRKEVYGSALKTTTLKALGLTSGKAMLRLRNRDSEEIKIQENVSVSGISTVYSESIVNHSLNDETDLRKKISDTAEQAMQVDDLDLENSKQDSYKGHNEKDIEAITLLNEGRKASPEIKKQKLEEMNEPKNKQSKELSADEIKELEKEIKIVGENDGVIFSLDSFKRVQESDPPDSFFDLTVDDVRLLLKDLKDQVKSLDDAPMLTAKLRDMENDQRILKLLQYKKTIIRIQFPDRHILQVTFNPVDTIEKVMKVVQKYLENPDLLFHLFTTPPKEILLPTARLVELKCVPQAIIHFGIEKDNHCENYLKKDLLQSLTSLDAAILHAMKSRGLPLTKFSPGTQTKYDDQEMRSIPAQGNSTNNSHSKQGGIPDNFQKSSVSSSSSVPKWFKL